jgi:putative phage-type endonuclease
MSLSDDDIATWCDEHLADLYDVGMYDYEDIADEVWEGVQQALQETVLDFLEDPDDRDAVAEQLQEAASDWFRANHTVMIEAIPTADPAVITALQVKPQVEQHSAEWYAQRRNRLTASEFAQILDGRRGALLRSKIVPPALDGMADRAPVAPVAIAQPDGEMTATIWGHRFEPIVRRIYEQELAGVGTVCDTLGRFTHHTVPWLSASPDGVVLRGPLTGRLVEIKAPKSRQPGDFVPTDYYVQMQIQMEVTDLDAVDFVEAQFTQRPVERYGLPESGMSDEDAAACAAAAWKGRVEVWGDLDDQTSWSYRYTAPVEDLDDAVFDIPEPAGKRLLESSVWWLTGWYPRTVLRNRIWWDVIGWPAAQEFWAEVESQRLNPILEVPEEEIIAHVGGWMGR